MGQVSGQRLTSRMDGSSPMLGCACRKRDKGPAALRLGEVQREYRYSAMVEAFTWCRRRLKNDPVATLGFYARGSTLGRR